MSQPRSIRKRAASVRRQMHAYISAVCSVYNSLSLERHTGRRSPHLVDVTYPAEGVDMRSVS
jgi:hypothetical protein